MPQIRKGNESSKIRDIKRNFFFYVNGQSVQLFIILVLVVDWQSLVTDIDENR